MILIGSKALKYYYSELKIGVDTDIVGNYDDVVLYMKSVTNPPISIYPIDMGKKLIAKYSNGTVIEGEINWGHSSPQLMEDIFNKSKQEVWDGDFIVPPLDFLYTLKMSHRYLRNSPHFLKTMEHIHLMRKLGAKIRPEYKEFLKIREKETYWYKHPKLNVGKKDFFNGDGVKYIYDHDSIHEAIKHLEKPAYKYYSTAEVMCSKQKWDSCSEEIKLYGVLEEAYVLSLERSQIPFKGKLTPKQSFEISLKKVCSSITSGYFREFAWESYYKIMDMYDDTYVDRFWKKVDNSEVELVTLI